MTHNKDFTVRATQANEELSSLRDDIYEAIAYDVIVDQHAKGHPILNANDITDYVMLKVKAQLTVLYQELQGASEQSKPQEQVGGKQVDTFLLEALERVVDGFSIHAPRGYPKGTLARRTLKKRLAKVVHKYEADPQQEKP